MRPATINDLVFDTHTEHSIDQKQSTGDNRLQLPLAHPMRQLALVESAPPDLSDIAKTDEARVWITERGVNTRVDEGERGRKTVNRVLSDQDSIGRGTEDGITPDDDAIRSGGEHLVQVDFETIGIDQAGGFDVAIEPCSRWFVLATKAEIAERAKRDREVGPRYENVCISEGTERRVLIEAVRGRRALEEAGVHVRLCEGVETRDRDPFDPEVDRQLHLMLLEQFVTLAVREVEQARVDGMQRNAAETLPRQQPQQVWPLGPRGHGDGLVRLEQIVGGYCACDIPGVVRSGGCGSHGDTTAPTSANSRNAVSVAASAACAGSADASATRSTSAASVGSSCMQIHTSMATPETHIGAREISVDITTDRGV
jgi:hypothetical protein